LNNKPAKRDGHDHDEIPDCDDVMVVFVGSKAYEDMQQQNMSLRDVNTTTPTSHVYL
jgi:hypothetical protein